MEKSKKTNEFDIFNIGVDDLEISNRGNGTTELYSPKPDQGKDGVYTALIRFLPNLNNPRKPFIHKFVHWLEDADGNGFYVDSPSTIGQSCPIQEKFFKLYNSDSAVEKKMAENLKRKEVFYSLIQIVDDKHNPDLNGQIKIFKFGIQIKTKIDEALKPTYDEPTQIFDPFNGKNFELKIHKKAGFPNYTLSKFLGDKSPIMIDGKKVTDDDKGHAKIIEYLKGAPDLTPYEYREWTDEQYQKVLNVLQQYGGSIGTEIDNLKKSNKSTKVQKQEDDIFDDSTTESDDLFEDIESDNDESNDSLDNDNLDDYLKGLDLD